MTQAITPPPTPTKEILLAEVAEIESAIIEGSPICSLEERPHIPHSSEYDTPDYLNTFLQELADICLSELPTAFPPLRGIEHNIGPITGAHPKKPRPYSLKPLHPYHNRVRFRKRPKVAPYPPGQPFPTTMLLNMAKRALQPTHPRGKKRRKLPTLQLPSKHLFTHWAHAENLRANSFQQGENDEILMGLFNAQELDKKTRRYLFDIILANICGLRWDDIKDNN